MSTQIKYKGAPVVTFNKGAVRLKTDDFGLEGDVEIVSSGGGSGEPQLVIADAVGNPITANGTYTASQLVSGADGVSRVKVEVAGGGSGGGSPLPIEVTTESAMNALLATSSIGSVYKYTGTSGTYENGALYVVEAVT